MDDTEIDPARYWEHIKNTNHVPDLKKPDSTPLDILRDPAKKAKWDAYWERQLEIARMENEELRRHARREGRVK